VNTYKEWLHLACKWATVGLDGDEFKRWQELITTLGKHCPTCLEGHICEDCHDTGLKLTALENMILRNIEMSLKDNPLQYTVNHGKI
jgi:hypothetical protein